MKIRPVDPKIAGGRGKHYTSPAGSSPRRPTGHVNNILEGKNNVRNAILNRQTTKTNHLATTGIAGRTLNQTRLPTEAAASGIETSRLSATSTPPRPSSSVRRPPGRFALPSIGHSPNSATEATSIVSATRTERWLAGSSKFQ